MANTYEIGSSKRGGITLVINGYIMKKKNRNDLYYWCYEKRNTLHYSGNACTMLINGQHNLRSTKEHNHSPDATGKYIVTAVHNFKRKACETTPARIKHNQCCF